MRQRYEIMTSVVAFYAALSVASLISNAASAQEIPEFNVERQCKQQASLVGNSNFMLKACYDQEQTSYDAVKSEWVGLDPKIKRTCIAQTKSFLPSYFMLNACIQQEVESRAAVEKFKFKR